MRRQVDPARRRHHLAALAVVVAFAVGAFAGCGITSSGAGPHGTLAGDVVAGPTCPVEHVDNPCPPKPVPDRQVTLAAQDGTTTATTRTDAKGHFTVDVAPGTYVVTVTTGPGMLGTRQITPGNATVTAGQTTTIKIELDTGIR